MLNADRVKLMTKMAIFERKERHEYLPFTDVSKKDYVGARRLVALIIFTLIYFAGAVSIVIFMLASLRLSADMDTLIRVGMITILLYVLLVFVLLRCVHVMYSKRYKAGMKKIDQYRKWYDELEALYKREETDTSPKLEAIDIATAKIETE